MIKPKALKKGSRIAIISPSTGLPSIFPGIYECGLKNLQELFGFEVIEYPTARMPKDVLYQHPELRAKDINDAFSDSAIDGIICTIGGYESVRILPYLDVDAILKHPKVIMGFSDATTFLSYFNTLGMVTFYGPSVMAGLAQLRHIPEAATEHIRSMLFGSTLPYHYKPYPCFAHGYKDWSIPETLGECTTFEENKGFMFLQGEEACEGQLYGGCIEVLEFLKSTRYWPDKEFWQGKILMFETSEDKPLPFQVGYMLRNYGIQGLFNKISGIIFGRPKDYTEQENKELHQIIIDIVRDEFGASHLPVIANVDFGHTEPKFILPLGVKVRIDPKNKSLSLVESPFSDR